MVFICNLDYDWYLSNQVHPPIARLCEPIAETDSRRLADCLGLDMNKYRAPTEVEDSYKETLHTLDSQMTEEQRFRDVNKFKPICKFCGETNVFPGVYHIDGNNITSGLMCANKSCARQMPTNSLNVQLENEIRLHVMKTVEQWIVCDDSSCSCRTRLFSVRSRKCPVPGCRGFMSFEYSTAKLMTQLFYYSSLFDVVKFDKEKGGLEGIFE